jgi:hypothetical protein
MAEVLGHPCLGEGWWKQEIRAGSVKLPINSGAAHHCHHDCGFGADPCGNAWNRTAASGHFDGRKTWIKSWSSLKRMGDGLARVVVFEAQEHDCLKSQWGVVSQRHQINGLAMGKR